MRKIVDILRASNGDITEKGLRATGLGYQGVRYIVVLLDELEMATRVGPRRQRVLRFSLEETLARLEGFDIPRAARVHSRHFVPSVDEMRLIHDPLCLFAPGAIFPADQVLPRDYAPDEPDQWAIGTRFERRKPGYPRQVYVYDGEKVRPE